jgi:hypothetical protein
MMESAIGPRSKKRGFKLRSSTKIAIGAVLIAGALYGVWRFGVGAWVNGHQFPPLKPGRVSLIGIQSGKGFKIHIAEGIAQLVEDKSAVFGPSDEDQAGDDSGGASKKRIPIGDMVATLGGDETALTKFFDRINEVGPKDDWPAESMRVIWPADKLMKAISGDAALQKQLETDLCLHLDGTPLTQITLKAISSGIVVDVPVPVRVNVGGQLRTMTAHVQKWFRPSVSVKTETAFSKKMSFSNTQIMAMYLEAASAAKTGDLRPALKSIADPATLGDKVRSAEEMLSDAEVILTDASMEHASSEPTNIGTRSLGSTPSGLWDLHIKVSEEGRLRLWKYSRQHMNDQLLLVSSGVAIAAPWIKQELFSSDFSIEQMPDEGLVQEAISTINNKQ